MAPNYEGLRRMQDYHRRFTATEYTSTQLGQMDASCGNCRRRDGLICLIKAKQIKLYNICNYWKHRDEPNR